MMDLTKFLSTVAAHPETRKFVGTLRDKGVGSFLASAGMFPMARMMVMPSIGIFAAGAVTGAVAAMLVTPRTGEAFRADIAEMIKNLRSQMEEKVSETTEKVTEATASTSTASGNGHGKGGSSRRASAS